MSQVFEFEKNGVSINSLTILAADFDADGLWSSDEKTVGNFNACSAYVVYESLDPNFQTPNGNQAVDFDLFARLETEVAPNHWHPIVSQVDPFDSEHADPTRRILTANPAAIVLDNTSEIFDGFDTSSVTRAAQVGSKVRLCLFKKPTNITPSLPFVSVTITADGQFFN